MTRGRRIAFTLFTVAAPLALVLVLLESGLRFWRSASAPADSRELSNRLAQSAAQEVKVVTTGNLKGLVIPSSLPDVIYELKPGRQWIFQGGFTQTNEHGMRNREVSVRKPPGTLRVAGLGDSVMFGWGVDQEVSYLPRLEKLMAGGVMGRKVEVLNFAVPGFNTVQEAALLKGKVEAFAPDLVLVGYVLNDWAAPFFLKDEEKGGIIEKSELFRVLTERLGRNAEKEYAGQGLDKALAALERIGSEARANGQVAMLFVFPQEGSDDAVRQIRETGARSGFVYVDMYPPFAEYFRLKHLGGLQDLFVKPGDPHPNPEGHELIARTLLPALVEALRLHSARASATR